MAKAKPNPRDAKRLQKLIALASALPEAQTAPFGERHLGFMVRKKTFAYHLDQHHDDGLVVLCAKSTPARQRELLANWPERYRKPAYLGPSGWVSLRLDLENVDWEEAAGLLLAAYRLQAPKRLLKEMEEG